jgi:signal transduction histidine kinase
MSQQLTSSETPQTAAGAKNELSACVPHGLRSQLNVIIGFTELLLDELPGPVNQEQRQCLNDIRESAWRLLGLMSDIFTPEDSDGNSDPKTHRDGPVPENTRRR